MAFNFEMWICETVVTFTLDQVNRMFTLWSKLELVLALAKRNDQICHLFNVWLIEDLFVDAVYLRFEDFV